MKSKSVLIRIIEVNVDKKGKVNRKAEIEKWIESWNSIPQNINRKYEVVESGMVGVVYYGAIKLTNLKDLSAPDSVTSAVIIISTLKQGILKCFMYAEGAGPPFYDCPRKVLRVLSAPETAIAEAWRARCEFVRVEKLKLDKLSVGKKLTVFSPQKIGGLKPGDKVILEKCVVYGVKTPVWLINNTDGLINVSTSDIVEFMYPMES